MREGGDTDEARASALFRMATARVPDAAELALLLDVVRSARADYTADVEAARALIAVGDSPPSEGAPPEELAAWTTLATLVLNLDETITR